MVSPANAAQSSDPLISVIMPAFNAAPFIKDSVNTVLQQDYPNLELIIVDDGSSDGTPEFVEGMDPRVKVLRQRNGGPGAARNLGIEHARGEPIAFLDADDLWLPGKLRLQVDYLATHPDVDMVYGSFIRWFANDDGSFPPLPSPRGWDKPADAIEEAESGWIYTALLFDNIVHIITSLLRRQVIEAVGGFDPTLRTGEDYDFWLRVSRRFKTAKLDRTLAYYRMHKASITHRPRSENNELRVLSATLAAHGPVGPDGQQAPAGPLKQRLFMLNFSHGYMHIRLGSAQVAQQAFWNALHYRPWHLKSWLYLAASSLKRAFVPHASA